MGNKGEVMCFLDRAGCQHGPTRGAGMHHVGVVPEDGQGVSCNRTGGYMDHRRRQFPGDLEHVGHHQQEALRRRKRRSESTFLQGAVEGTCRACLRLHLDDIGYLAPEVRFPRRGPIIGQLTHRGSRRYRVNGDHF